MDDPDKGDAVTPFMDFYKENIQSYGSLDKLKLRILVRGDFQNKDIIGYTWYPTSSMSTLNYFLEYASRNKVRVHQLNFIGEFIQANVKHIFFV